MKRCRPIPMFAAIAACLAALSLPAATAKWTDRDEYDLVLSIRGEAAPQKRLAMLDQWKAKYPKTELQQVRQELYLGAYQSLGDGARMLAVAREMISVAPDNLVGLYWYTLLLPEAKEVSPDLLASGEKASRQLLAAGSKQKRRGEVEFLAHRTLSWIAWQRSDYAAAEAAFAECLKLDPNSAEISSWFGTVLALDRQPANQVPALWHLARAASYRGPGALPDVQRRQLGPVLDRLYTTYHGEIAGLDQLRTAAAVATFPPAGFDIESATAAALRKQDEELSRTNPQLAAWIRIRRRLEAPDADAYFATSLRNTPLPMRLKGTLIRATPTELTLGVSSATAEEVTVKLDASFPNDAPLGTILEFDGTIDAFTKAPFSLTVLTSLAKIEGRPRK